MRVTYIGLLLSLYISFHGSRGVTTEARSNSSMGSRRLAPLMWTLVCDVDQKEQGIIVLLQSLSNNKKAEKALSNLISVESYTENGLNLSLEKLDAAFQSEDVEDAYNIFLKFSYLKRHCDISMNDYITEF